MHPIGSQADRLWRVVTTLRQFSEPLTHLPKHRTYQFFMHEEAGMHACSVHRVRGQKAVPPPRFELGAKDRPEEISVIYYVI